MKSSRKRWVLWWGVGLPALVILIFLAREPLLRGIGSFLIVQDPLEPAVAIVSMGGKTPFREMEAARLYRAGWAPKIIVVRELRTAEWKALRELGVAAPEEWEMRRQVLLRLGVPDSAILIPKGEAQGTLEELRIVYQTLKPQNAPVILVSSKYHTRRVRLTWRYVTEGKTRAVVRPAPLDPFDAQRWWRDRRFILSVVREYMGLGNYLLGYPVS